MQASACLTASLIYAWAGVHAWRVPPGSTRLKCAAIVIFPAIYLGAAVTLPLVIAPLRRLLKRYVWMSFTAGFGQTPISVLAAWAYSRRRPGSSPCKSPRSPMGAAIR
jgi:hypothetical protein